MVVHDDGVMAGEVLAVIPNRVGSNQIQQTLIA